MGVRIVGAVGPTWGFCVTAACISSVFLKRLEVEEAQNRDAERHRAIGEFLVFEKSRLIPADVVRSEVIESFLFMTANSSIAIRYVRIVVCA